MKKVILALILGIIPSIYCFGQRVEGSANANLKGRTVAGSLPKPSYGVQAEGIVVVQIKVDQYGNVTEAIPGAEGTTATNKALWNAARNAAIKAHFNMKADAPALQTGTITYVFRLKGEKDSTGKIPGGEEPLVYTVKELVENLAEYDYCSIKGEYVKTVSSSDLTFLVEHEDYIIPVVLVKKDLGADKRFQSMHLQEGDTLIIRGKIDNDIFVSVWGEHYEHQSGHYKGLVDATILERKPGPAASNKTSGRVTPIERSETATDGEMSVIGEEQFRQFDERPLFKGGDANMFSMWVNSHLVYPEKAKENGIQGRVILQFTIKADGRVTDVKVLRGIDKFLDKEAVRVVSSSPKWTPGKSAGKPVDVTMTFPVIFQLR